MKFIIHLPPAGQMRPRAVNRGSRAGVHKHPKQARREQNMLALLAAFRPEKPLEGPLALRLKVYYPLPVSKSQKWQKAAQAGSIRPTVKPDLSNLLKHLEDCLSQLGFWQDDKQVVEYLPGTGKYYNNGQGVRWEVELVSLEPLLAR